MSSAVPHPGEPERFSSSSSFSPPSPVASYVPYVITGNLLFVSGQLPFDEHGVLSHNGKIGANVTLEHGQDAARLCALNILAQVQSAVGTLDRVIRCVKIGGFVACTADFTAHPKVIDSASQVMKAALGEKGDHARFAVGVASLPLDSVVEIDAIFEIS